MAKLETEMLSKCPIKPLHYKRFIDDVGSLFICSKDDILTFGKFVNSYHNTIKFTIECSESHMIFLDITLFKGSRFQKDGILDIKTYFISPRATHPLANKASSRREILRYLRNNSDENNFLKDKNNFISRLLVRGYPATVIHDV